MAVKLVDDDIVGSKLHFQYVWGAVHPEMRESFNEPALRRLVWRPLSHSNMQKPEIKLYNDIKKSDDPIKFQRVRHISYMWRMNDR